jgi:hypothetical protein
MNIVKSITKTVKKKKELDFILSTREIKSLHEITKNDFLVTFLPIINKDIGLEHGLDYIKVLSKDKNFKIEKIMVEALSIAISAMVTSYARLFITKIKFKILNSGGKIYYYN